MRIICRSRPPIPAAAGPGGPPDLRRPAGRCDREDRGRLADDGPCGPQQPSIAVHQAIVRLRTPRRVALSRARTMDELVAGSMAQPRRAELGLRMALGADPGDILRLVLREGMRPVAAGILIGLAGAAEQGERPRHAQVQLRKWRAAAAVDGGAGADVLELATPLPSNPSNRSCRQRFRMSRGAHASVPRRRLHSGVGLPAAIPPRSPGRLGQPPRRSPGPVPRIPRRTANESAS